MSSWMETPRWKSFPPSDRHPQTDTPSEWRSPHLNEDLLALTELPQSAPPPKQTPMIRHLVAATEAGGTHPTGMHSC